MSSLINPQQVSQRPLSSVQEVEPDDTSLMGLSVPGDVAKKLLHYLKQKLPSWCLEDLLCSHAFSKHYLRRGGGRLEDEELLGEDTGGVKLPVPAAPSHSALFCSHRLSGSAHSGRSNSTELLIIISLQEGQEGRCPGL